MFDVVKYFLWWNNDRRVVDAICPSLGQGDIDIIVIDLRIEKSSENLHMIDVPTMFSDQSDEIPKVDEFSDSGMSFYEIHLLIAVND
jgi:hypothetical protein